MPVTPPSLWSETARVERRTGHVFGRFFAIGLLVAIVIQGSQLLEGHGLAFTLRVGNEAPAASLISAELGGIPLTRGIGHDGQYGYLVGRDPWGLGGHVALSDDPAYRLRRPLLGWLAGAFGTLPPSLVLFGLSAISALGFALGAGSAGVIIESLGLPRWAHVAILGCIGLWLSLQLVTPDALMIGLIVAAVASMLTGRPVPAVLGLAAAVLTKEVALLSVIGLAGWAWLRGSRKLSLSMLIIPTATLFTWLWWVERVFDDGMTPKGNLGPPIEGIADSVPQWTGIALGFGALGLTYLVVGVAGAAVSRSTLIWFQVIPWTAMAVLSSVVVWGEANNTPRVFAMAWVAGIFGLALGQTRARLHRSRSQTIPAPLGP